MTVSAISTITKEDYVLSLTAFVRSGVPYALWAIPISGARRIQWTPYTGTDLTSVLCSTYAPFINVAAIIDVATDRLVVAWNDTNAAEGSSNGSTYVMIVDPDTGIPISGPTRICEGSCPSLMYRGDSPGDNLLMSVTFKKTGDICILESKDGGVSWDTPKPILTAQVRDTSSMAVVPYDDSHVSVFQIGDDCRRLVEVGVYYRTRPLVSVVKHPTQANKVFIGEPSYASPKLNDYLRGALLAARDDSNLFNLDGARLGSSDVVGAIALLSVATNAPSLEASAGPLGDGDDVTKYSLVPATVVSTDLGGTDAVAVDADLSDDYIYVAGYADNDATSGYFWVYKISDQTQATILSDLDSAVRAVAVGYYPASTPSIFLATTEAGVQKLRVYSENGLTPSLETSHKLPARVNAIKAVMTSGTEGTLYLSMTDRLNIYALNGLTSPLRLLSSYTMKARGQFFRVALSSNGNLVCAAGAAGVMVINPDGRVLAQYLPAGITPYPWKPSTAYSLNDVVRTRDTHPFAPFGLYFICTTAGTSGAYEPGWKDDTAPNSINDGTAKWASVAQMTSVITSVAIDETGKRVFAAGVAGGSKGTAGRLWVLNAMELV